MQSWKVILFYLFHFQMANLKADLDNYLNAGKKSNLPSLSNLASTFSLPTLKSPFGSSNADNADTELLMEEGSQSSAWGSSNNGESVKDSCCPSLSKKQRIFGFCICLGMGVLCFTLAAFYVPVIVVFARKFALLFSLGSAFTLSSFSFLYGPYNHFKHLASKERLPFTLVYMGSLFGTLYFALALQSTVLTVLAAAAQVIALFWFTLSYIPGGQTGLKFMARIGSSLCRTTTGASLPI